MRDRQVKNLREMFLTNGVGNSVDYGFGGARNISLTCALSSRTTYFDYVNALKLNNLIIKF